MANEVQRFDITPGGSGSAKTFTLEFEGAVTAPITYKQSSNDPTVAAVQTALDGLSTIGPGNVVVSQDVAWGYVCSFQNDLGDQDLNLMSADDSGLGGATIAVSSVTHGYPPIDTANPPFASLALPVTLHRLELGMQAAFVVTPGIHHQIVVNTDGTNLILSHGVARG